MNTFRHPGARAPVLLYGGVLVIAGGLMVLTWQQWQSELLTWQQSQSVFVQAGDGNFRLPAYDYLPSFSRGWEEEQEAWHILEDAGTEISSGLPVQSAAHLREAHEFYRRAVLKRPLCVYCQYSLARVTTLLEIMSRTPEQVTNNPSSWALAGFQRSLTLAPTRADLWKESGLFLLDFWPSLSESERHFVLTCLQQALTLDQQLTEEILVATFVVDRDLPATVSGEDPRRGFAAARVYQKYEDTERAQRQAQEVAARLREAVKRPGDTETQGHGDTGTVTSSQLLLLGEVELFLHNQEAARDAYARGFAEAQDPALRKDLCWRLAEWYLRSKEYVTAGEYYRRYLTLSPDSAQAVLRLGTSVLRAGNREEGIHWLERAAGMRLEDVNWQKGVSRLFEEAGRYDRANAIYRRLLAQQGQPPPDLLRALARNYKNLGLQQQALATYRQLLTVDAGNAEAQAFIKLAEKQD